MPKLLFSYSLYHAKTQDYEAILIKIKEEFGANVPDIFLNNPEYLVLSLKEKEWQKEIVSLIERLKTCVNTEVEHLRSKGENIHIVYRFGILEMESKFFQYPPDLEDDD
ncbi:hypothetical protein [Helicobacter turcicus]|uniref:Uncharacterized protein n=1 Tax=Helicobacter turcicus TaxID=2867412 RepID=A0ABS7JPJ9_9HELI|nr:hypothetical protein [Helicobacter turcicus]MBX7491336.1 hypothetical protein [Helicobacter turcicus]MBX7546177.1 hypothetical protein [Helicobacter turcicus]